MIYVDNASEYSQRIYIPRDESVSGADITGATYALQDKYYMITKNGETIQIRPDAGYDGISGGTITVRVQATGGTTYFPGTNIDISEDNVISVTGLTEAIEDVVTGITLDYATTGDVATMISEAVGDFVTSGDVQTQIDNSTSAFTTSADVITIITSSTSGFATVQYVDNSVSGKADTSAVTEAISAATQDMATETWVNEQGFLTEEQSLSAYSTTEETRAMITAATSGFTTSGEVETMITSATSALTTTGDVETMITSATSGLATTQDVENAVSGLATTQYVDDAVSGKADTTAVTQSISDALSSYTPTSNFATINGSGITEGGNIVIEGGGDASSVEMITELPDDPVDGAVYNYNGVLVKFVDGPGKWGYWSGADVLRTYNRAMFESATLFYGVIPESMDGGLVFGFGNIKSNTAQTQIWCYFNLENDTIDVYDNSGKTGSVLYQIQRNAGSETYISNSNVQVYVSWNDNVIQLRPVTHYVQLLIPCDTEISTSHYELVQPLTRSYPISRDMSLDTYISTPTYYLAYFDYTSGDVYPGKQVYDRTIFINNSGYSSPWNYCSSLSSSPIQRMYVPTASGETGSLLVSQGDTEPQFKTVVQALGIDFWTGTQDEYDALESHSSTTLYIIIPDNS